MSRYHVNPETGNPGRCQASYSCPFGDENQHFSSEAEARDAYETQLAELQEFRESPLGALDAATDKAFEKLQIGFDKAVQWVDDHPKIVIGTLVAVGAIVAGVLAHRAITSHYASISSKLSEGTILSGRYDRQMVGKVSDTDTVYQVSTGNGSVIELRNESRTLIPDGQTIAFHEYTDGTFHETSAVDEASMYVPIATIGGAVGGGAAGLLSGILGGMGVYRLSEYLDARWDMRHEKRFGLTNWRATMESASA